MNKLSDIKNWKFKTNNLNGPMITDIICYNCFNSKLEFDGKSYYCPKCKHKVNI